MLKSTWKEVRQQLSRLFKFPIIVDGIEFEDLTFYRGGHIKCSVCAHEEFCLLELSEKELKQFNELGIKYKSE